MTKIGLLLAVVGLLLLFFLLKIRPDKKFLKNLGIVFGFLLFIYGLILFVQPSDDSYIMYTKTTKASH